MPEKQISLVPSDIIQSKIIVLRGKKVLLDYDLARLYEVPTKRLNEQVKRNSRRFPENFMFQLRSLAKITFTFCIPSLCHLCPILNRKIFTAPLIAGRLKFCSIVSSKSGANLGATCKSYFGEAPKQRGKRRTGRKLRPVQNA